MLKTRIIGVLVLKEGIVVQSIGFKKYLPVGAPSIAVEYLDNWGIDEIIILDIDATPKNRKPLFNNIKSYTRSCNVPITIGGGITCVDDMKKIIHEGADKVSINTASIKDFSLITKGAELFGQQCIIVSIDAKKISENDYKVFINSGSINTGYSPEKVAIKAEKYGAGEILINSIDHDGSKKGYDLPLIKKVVKAVNIPVIACGGANCPDHFKDVMKINVSAAAANFFHYTEHSVIILKSYLNNFINNIRLDSYETYDNFMFDESGRVAKLEDDILDKLRFEYIPPEII